MDDTEKALGHDVKLRDDGSGSLPAEGGERLTRGLSSRQVSMIAIVSCVRGGG